MSTIGGRLKEIRELVGMTQKELSGLTRITVRAIRDIECDRNEHPCEVRIRVISKALNINPAWLHYGGRKAPKDMNWMRRHRECVEMADKFFAEVLPQAGKLVFQDYDILNRLGMLLTKLKEKK